MADGDISLTFTIPGTLLPTLTMTEPVAGRSSDAALPTVSSPSAGTPSTPLPGRPT